MEKIFHYIKTDILLVIKFLLNINYDSSGAYRCYNVKKVKLNHILLARDNGYSFFWQSIFLLHKKRYKIFEIPILICLQDHMDHLK